MRTLLTTLALAASMCIMAQDGDDDKGGKTPDARAQHRTEMMTKDLGLTAEQIAKVNPINITYARSMSEVREMQDGDAKKNRSRILRDKRDADLKAVLTADQFTKMMVLREKKKAEKDKKAHNE